MKANICSRLSFWVHLIVFIINQNYASMLVSKGVSKLRNRQKKDLLFISRPNTVAFFEVLPGILELRYKL